MSVQNNISIDIESIPEPVIHPTTPLNDDKKSRNIVFGICALGFVIGVALCICGALIDEAESLIVVGPVIMGASLFTPLMILKWYSWKMIDYHRELSDHERNPNLPPPKEPSRLPNCRCWQWNAQDACTFTCVMGFLFLCVSVVFFLTSSNTPDLFWVGVGVVVISAMFCFACCLSCAFCLCGADKEREEWDRALAERYMREVIQSMYDNSQRVDQN